jgi:hypothetical protein
MLPGQPMWVADTLSRPPPGVDLEPGKAASRPGGINVPSGSPPALAAADPDMGDSVAEIQPGRCVWILAGLLRSSFFCLKVLSSEI